MKKTILFLSSLMTFSSFAQVCLPVRSVGGFYLTSTTHYFAQEYTGADLVREELIKDNTSIPGNLVLVMDSVVEDHAYSVMNLISSQTDSAPIPLMTPTIAETFNDAYFTNGVDKNLAGPMIWKAYAQNCSKLKNCPSFINQSMFIPRPEWFEPISLFTKQNTIIVGAAGNDMKLTNAAVPELSVEASKKYNYILVGSSTPTGSISLFSRTSPEVVITAPSDYDVVTGGLLSRDATKVTSQKFSGTSGAAPQVTAALVVFEGVSGYHPTLAEAKTLLTRSAIKLKDDTKLHGAGNLNTYKIFEIAKKISQECAGNKTCAADIINDDKSYAFSEVDTENAKLAFASCFHQPASKTEVACDVKKEALKTLRRASLLNPGNKEIAAGLSCIYKELNFLKNSTYYLNLSKAN